MEELDREESVDVDDQHFISLEFSRPWPNFEVRWSLRERSGDTDFPLAGGAVRALPKQGEDAASQWEELREQALAEARDAVPTETPSADKGSSFMDRLLGRR